MLMPDFPCDVGQYQGLIYPDACRRQSTGKHDVECVREIGILSVSKAEFQPRWTVKCGTIIHYINKYV